MNESEKTKKKTTNNPSYFPSEVVLDPHSQGEEQIQSKSAPKTTHLIASLSADNRIHS